MLTYRFADKLDIHTLVSLRLNYLNLSPRHEPYDEIKEKLTNYFKDKILNNQCIVMLAEDNAAIIGNGILFFYDTVPSAANKSGKNGYITNLYVNEDYKKENIATLMLTKLVEIARERGCNAIILDTSENDEELYSRHGFAKMKGIMIYDIPNERLKNVSENINPNDMLVDYEKQLDKLKESYTK